jgi:hypothetical protein
MSESFYNQFKWAVDRLSSQDFVILCFHYLADTGYKCNFGPVRSRDQKHDIYGFGRTGAFVAHCTTQATKLKQKALDDVLEGVNYCKSLSEPKAEILFFSGKRVFNSPLDETMFLEKLCKRITDSDGRYEANPPSVAFKSADQLAQEICSLNEESKAYTFLHSKISRYLRTNYSGDESFLLEEEDIETDSIPSEEGFLELLSNYSETLPLELEQELLHSIIAAAWDSIVFQPLLAAKLIGNASLMKGKLARLIEPLCKIALGLPISASDLSSLIITVGGTQPSVDTFSRNRLLLISRLLRSLFYHQPDVLRAPEPMQELKTLSASGGQFWQEFFLDLYLRDQCDQIYVHSDFLSMMAKTRDSYCRQLPNKPLARILPWISSPLETTVHYSKGELTNLIKDIARECTNIIEAKWSLAMLFRIFPLYDSSDEEIDYSDLVSSVIEQFDESLASRSRNLGFIYLQSLLRAFLRTKDPRFIEGFESRFLSLQHRLLPPQLHHLQLEYASSIYVCCQCLGDDEISELRFAKLLRAGRNLLDHSLFRNQLVQTLAKLAPPPTFDNRGLLNKWLISYIATLYRLYAAPLIQENHIRALQFKATSRVYEIRPALCASVLSSLNRSVDPALSFRPSFYAKSTSAFSLIPRSQNMALMREYLRKALTADKYALVRNAKSISEGLYSCYYYGDNETVREAESLAKSVAKILEIGTSIPNLYWAYYASIKYHEVPLEAEFLHELWSESKKITRKVNQLALRRGEVVGIIFPDRVLEIIKLYVRQGSLFAQAAGDNLINPELWNIFGTTVFNHRKENQPESLETSAQFYSLAKCFARERKDYDQKYCYNYIRCKALAYKNTNTSPEDFYLRDAAFYLARHEAVLFTHKIDCTTDLFDLIKQYWSHIAEETQMLLHERLSRVGWAKQELHARELL